jgi:hypothetical protein
LRICCKTCFTRFFEKFEQSLEKYRGGNLAIREKGSTFTAKISKRDIRSIETRQKTVKEKLGKK